MAYSKSQTLLDYYKGRNRLLIIRNTGGLGDILMCRMMFEDFKIANPNCKVVFACPTFYHPAVEDHPFVDEIVDSNNVDIGDYFVGYDITTACGKEEGRCAPMPAAHRSDIWAKHCGLELKHHNMHLTVPDHVTARCRSLLEQYRTNPFSPIVLLCPKANTGCKDLDIQQTQGVIDGLKSMNCCVLCLSSVPVPDVNTPTIIGKEIIDFFGFIKAADYIVTVDTATFHAAGGLNKPQVAIFTWADGKVYGKYYDKVILVQRHRDNGNWDCGPCYLWFKCPKTSAERKPCITTITAEEIVAAFKVMIEKWPLSSYNDK
jgi:ADP-heptose:LPS heptosyltransferase